MSFLGFLKSTSRHERAADRYIPVTAKMAGLADEMKELSHDQLKQRVIQYKGKSFDELREHIPEIFAAVREAGDRILSLRHFEVQLQGGLILLEGAITEMKTGEGKTLVATLPLILHGLTGRGAHLVTVNDYLATRDAEWMRPLYEFFDLTIGVIIPGMAPAEKRRAYAADITYGTNNEFAFDYLRDNMAQRKEDMVQRGLSFGIIDEVDSILIDEARTPLIISAPDIESTQLYPQFAQLAPQLRADEDYNIDEKRRAVLLTDAGVSRVEKLLAISNLYEDKGIRFVHHLEQALRAHAVYQKDKDYVVRDGEVLIVDEFTGRLMEGRRYSEGLHQAIEAKERVPVQQESRTLATITFQNFFRLYDSLAGMTGTAVTSAEEFEKVYNLDVVVVPTNRELARIDHADKIFVSEKAKFTAVVKEIMARHTKGQPVLVGTIAIEKSEYLSKLLQREGVVHEVLNAKHHAREAEIIAKAGQRGAVTISTNMAGRGTDIKLGEGVAGLGGLLVLGTERHEARRIDNQLRGRSGRQGDPGETQFFVSMEDDVMRVFGGDRIRSLMTKLKLPDDEPIENRLVTRALTSAQERVEGYYFDMRKQVLSFDDVLNRQRSAIYILRRSVLLDGVWRDAGGDEDLHQHVVALLQEQAEALVNVHAASEREEDWNVQEIAETLSALLGETVADIARDVTAAVAKKRSQGPEVLREELKVFLSDRLTKKLSQRLAQFGDASLRSLEKAATMRAIDTHWMDHLDTMDYLRTGIGLRGYGQRDPLVEYQKEGYQLFQQLLATIKQSIIDVVMRAQPTLAEAEDQTLLANQKTQGGEEGSALASSTWDQSLAQNQVPPKPMGDHGSAPLKNKFKNVGRNDLCPCGSGKKFKKCHGQ